MAVTINGTAGITFNNATTQAAAVTAGNGISVASAVVAVACPTFNTVGSYCMIGTILADNTSNTPGANYSVGTGTGQIQSACINFTTLAQSNNLSGTWKWMGSAGTGGEGGTISAAIGCRVS